MRKYLTSSLPLVLAILLAVTACDDDAMDSIPTTVTLSSGGVSTEFDMFLHATVSFLGLDVLIITAFTSSDTLLITSFAAGALGTDVPISLSDSLGLIIGGTLGGGQMAAISGPGATGTFTFTRLNLTGVISGEFSNNATLLGFGSDSTSIIVDVSGGFSALGGELPAMSILPKRVKTLLPSVEGH